ncbi:MAG: hypothetical protein ACYTG0_14305 [Planctomycetota bacterium]|jgi:hypothetical protein
MNHVYKTKDDIYNDYQLAIKFSLPGGSWRVDEYPLVYDELVREGWSLDSLPDEVKELGGGPQSFRGLEFKSPRGDRQCDGVILEHETGLEVFLLGVAVGAVGGAIGGIAAAYGVRLIDQLVGKLGKRKWRGTTNVTKLQLRTHKNGVVEVDVQNLPLDAAERIVRHVIAGKPMGSLETDEGIQCDKPK